MNDDEDERTIWIGNLSQKVTEDILYELFLQAAPLQKVKIPKDKDGKQCNYAFVTFKHQVSVPYATELLNGTELYNKPLNVKPRNSNSQQQNQNNSVQQLRFPQALNGLNSSPGLLPKPARNSNHMHSPQDNTRGRWDNSNYHQDRRRYNDSPYGRRPGIHFPRNHNDRYINRFNNNDNRDFGKRKHRH